MSARRLLTWMVLALTVAAAAPALATETTRHSGTVVMIDPARGSLVIEEVGPWVVKDGVTVVTRRSIVLTSATKFNMFMRVDVPGRFAHDFIEVALDPGDVSPGDFVTAECIRRGGRLVALTVTVAEVSE